MDITREIDLIEEIARHWGLDRIEATFPALTSVPRPATSAVARGRLLRRTLCGAGLQEAVTFTFVDARMAAPYQIDAPVRIANPLSEKFAVMRPSLIPGLYESLVFNRNRQAGDVRLFEVGTIFSSTVGERQAVGWVMTGSRGTHWSGNGGPIGFADTRGIAELIGDVLEVKLDVTGDDRHEWLARGERGAFTIAGQPVGWGGRLASTPEIEGPVYVGELDVDTIASLRTRERTIRRLPRFPSVVRDLSLLVDERLPAADVRGTIRTSAPSTLAEIREFDRYQGKGVPQGLVSLSLRLTFRHLDRTLTDAEVQQAVDDVVEALVQAHGATLRGR